MSKPRTGAPKRVAVGLLAGALAMFGVALAPPAGAAASVTTDRLAGTTRYGTASTIATSSTFSAPTTAIVATGENFPDALAAASLAGANAQAPIVLTETGTYSPDAKAALTALKAKGVNAVTIVGGTAAIAQSVEDAIKADGFTVSRVAGDDRYETAAAIASQANTKSAAAPIAGLKAALIATGTNFPDALAGGPAAYANKLPLLLVNDTVPAETSNAISTLGIKKVYILGGTNAVSSTVEAQLVTATGNPATRLAGTNRYSTATTIADFEKTTLGFPITSVLLATGENFPDALSAGPLGGQRKAPVILTSTATLSPEASSWLDANSSTINSITAVGGTNAVADTVLAAAKTAAQNVSNDSAAKAVTTRPELTGAQIVETVATNQATATKLEGTYVRYTFDEALGTAFAPQASFFHVYNSTAPATAIDGTTATIETGTGTTGTTVLVRFSTLNTSASTVDLSKATVDFEAVRDAGGAGNPEGAAGVGTAGTSTSSAGVTTAPDLVSVGNFRTASATNLTAVDFTFDQAANVATTSGFHLVVAADNSVVNCTSTSTPSVGGGTTTVPGGSGNTIITVTCPNAGGGTTQWSASTVARGYVEAGSVATGLLGTGSLNPLQAADVTGNTLGPDLVSVSVSQASLGTGPTPASVAIFTFDTAVTNATGSNFHLYTSTATRLDTISTGDPAGGCTTATTNNDSSNGFRCTINASNPTQVRVVFAGNAGVVGGNVDAQAVQTANASPFTYNQPDEEGTAAAASVTRAPGKITGPDLVSVALSGATDAFGNASGFRATYTFDTAVAISPTASKFFLYFADGTKFTAGSCITGTDNTVAATTVTCSSYVNSITSIAPSPASTGVGPAVLGTVDNGAVTTASVGGNTEDAAATTGGTGTPAS